MAAELHHHLCLHQLLTALTLAAMATVLAKAVPLPLPPPLPPGAAAPNATEQFLSVHNRARAAVRVAPLRWSPALAGEASRVAEQQRSHERCEFADLDSSPHGANQAWADYPTSPADAAETWVAEGKYYDYGSNSCAAAGHDCGTYTQVVWRRTEELGCAQATCGGRGTLTVCLYNPHGNVEGEKPY